ncbi:hypothetical protein ACFX2I_035871 [Malus domestica]
MVHGLQLARPWPRPRRGDIVGDIEAPQGIDRGGGHESTDLDFISTTKIMSILIVCSSQFLVSTIVQVVGIILSLHAATKISSRAQGIATIASRWHTLMICSSNDSPHTRSSDSLVNFEAANRLSSLHISYSESDLESTDYVHVPTNSQLVSHMASYHKRQAFGMHQLMLFQYFLFEKMALLVVIYGFRLFISHGSVLLIVDCGSYSIYISL